MARPKRDGDWVPLTARVDAESARRLRVAAATRGTTAGRILDELILGNLPAVAGGRPVARESRPPRVAASIERLRTEMDRLGLSQSDLARGLGISPRAVSGWFQLGAVPAQRHQAIAAFLANQRKKP
ncbi:MAG: helix-turn-helix transcriptional regulator [Nitrospira sp.]|nr:helix-turn-helix transcriptional regulator [Nitrospira sp.]